MNFTSVRDKNKKSNFYEAINAARDFLVIESFESVERWMLYADSKTGYASIVGALTSAFIKQEFSPVLSEAIAMHAVNFSPRVLDLSEDFLLLDLTKTPSGSHIDFSIFYLASAMEQTLRIRREDAWLISVGGRNRSVYLATEGMKHVNVLLFAENRNEFSSFLQKERLLENGGNVLPVLVSKDKNTADFAHLALKSFLERGIKASAATSYNIGWILAEIFFFSFAFTRLKNSSSCRINYAVDAGSYATLLAALYAWRLSLPLSAVYMPATNFLSLDALEDAVFIDSFVPREARKEVNPFRVNNIERVEDFFSFPGTNPDEKRAAFNMAKLFLRPRKVDEKAINKACRELYMNWGIYANRETAAAYSAVKNEEEGSVKVLVMKDDASFSKDFILHTLGEEPPESPIKLESAENPYEGRILTAQSVGDVLEMMGVKRATD